MAGEVRVTGQAYYDVMPGSELQVGDIWKDLPTFGHWREPTTSGLVITPACDLSNNKTETVTFLPVLPLRRYLTGRSFAVELVRIIKAQDSLAGLGIATGWPAKASILPATDLLRRVQDAACSVINKGAKGNVTAAARRCNAAANVLVSCRVDGKASMSDVKLALGEKECSRILTEIVRNAYSSDIHFLPADGRAGISSAMQEHSVALFRYPLSLPVEVLQAANEIAITDWTSAMRSLQREYPLAAGITQRPIKIGALRPRFLADLISRFATLHVRMGSPDFTRETVDRYVQELQEGV